MNTISFGKKDLHIAQDLAKRGVKFATGLKKTWQKGANNCQFQTIFRSPDTGSVLARGQVSSTGNQIPVDKFINTAIK